MDKITRAEAKKIIDMFAKESMNISMRDIAYCILRNFIDEEELCYKTIFAKVNTIPYSDYARQAKVAKLNGFITKRINEVKEEKKKGRPAKVQEEKDTPQEEYANMTFDENRSALITKLDELEQQYKDGEISYEKYYKLALETRKILNDKFEVNEKVDQQRVVVECKYNHICDYLQRECLFYTKEYAMEHFGLVEKNNETAI